MALYKQYVNTKPLATLCISNWGGIEVLDIQYGIEDYLVACFNWGENRQQIRHHKICTARSGRLYFWKQGVRYYLDQFLRV